MTTILKITYVGGTTDKIETNLKEDEILKLMKTKWFILFKNKMYINLNNVIKIDIYTKTNK